MRAAILGFYLVLVLGFVGSAAAQGQGNGPPSGLPSQANAGGLSDAVDQLAADLEAETANREAADAQLSADLDAEAAARQAADAQLSQDLASEAAARVAADAQLSADLDAEAAVRQAADAQLSQDLASEAAARVAADAQLSADLDGEAAARQAAAAQLSQDLASETAARVAADAQLSADLDGEAAARQAADAQLSQDLASETAARVAADAQLSADLDAEAAARQAADDQLSADLDAEAAARQAADTSEANTRSAADQLEATARDGADAALDARIVVLENSSGGGGGSGGFPLIVKDQAGQPVGTTVDATVSSATVMIEVEDSTGTSHSVFVIVRGDGSIGRDGPLYFDQTGCTGNVFVEPSDGFRPASTPRVVIEHAPNQDGEDDGKFRLYVAVDSVAAAVTSRSKYFADAFCRTEDDALDLLSAELISDANGEEGLFDMLNGPFTLEAAP